MKNYEDMRVTLGEVYSCKEQIKSYGYEKYEEIQNTNHILHITGYKKN